MFSNSNAQLLGLKEVYTNNTYLLIADNALPSVTVTAPTNDTRLCICEPFLFRATAGDIDGSITNLSLLVGTNVVASFTNGGTQVLVHTNDLAGYFTFTARAQDNMGGERIADPVTVLFTGKGGTNSIGVYRFSTNSVKLCMEGEPGKDYDLEASPSVETPSWNVIGQMSPTNGLWQFIDTNLTSFPQRYYRAIRLPRSP